MNHTDYEKMILVANAMVALAEGTTEVVVKVADLLDIDRKTMIMEFGNIYQEVMKSSNFIEQELPKEGER